MVRESFPLIDPKLTEKLPLGTSVFLATAESIFIGELKKTFFLFDRTLSTGDEQLLNLALIKKALKNVHANLQIPESALEDEDKTMLKQIVSN